VLNYVSALNYGLKRLTTLPISVRLLNELHAELLAGVRGDDKEPGLIRSKQVYIGTPGSTIGESRYIPPPPGEITRLLGDWEEFANTEGLEMPPLIQAALLHYQFEAIHPYVDGNGRIGRLLIALCLAAWEVMPTPLLYISGYFERHRDAYMDHLLAVSVTGNWLPWLEFFLSAVSDQARDALIRSRSVRDLHSNYQARLQARAESANAFRFLDHLFTVPVTTPSQSARVLGITRAGARALLDRLVDAKILTVVAQTRPRFYVARELLEILQAPIAR
jgi:Fic family protein